AVGGRGRDDVGARRERAEGDAAARADRAVPARGPGDDRGEAAVLQVAGGGGEGGRRADLEDRAARGRGDGDGGRGVDDDRDRHAGALAAAVRDRGDDRVGPRAERARGDAAARPEDAVAARDPGDARGEVAVLGVGRRGGEGDGGPRLVVGAARRGRDRDVRGRVDRDGDRRTARLARGVGGRGGDDVRAGRERAHRHARARAEEAVPARGPDDRRGEVAVLGVGGRRGEGDGGARLERRARGRGDRDDGRGVDRDGDHGVGGLAAAVGDRGGDGVRAGGERARRDRAARAERAVAARGPGDGRGEVAVLG